MDIDTLPNVIVDGERTIVDKTEIDRIANDEKNICHSNITNR